MGVGGGYQPRGLDRPLGTFVAVETLSANQLVQSLEY